MKLVFSSLLSFEGLQGEVIISKTSKNNNLIRSCEGRGVFVYDLPPKFNKDILARCDDILPLASLCDLLNNEGMGQPVPKLGKGCYTTYQFSLEIIFHSRILNHPCRVRNAENTTVFYEKSFLYL